MIRKAIIALAALASGPPSQKATFPGGPYTAPLSRAPQRATLSGRLRTRASEAAFASSGFIRRQGLTTANATPTFMLIPGSKAGS